MNSVPKVLREIWNTHNTHNTDNLLYFHIYKYFLRCVQDMMLIDTLAGTH